MPTTLSERSLISAEHTQQFKVDPEVKTLRKKLKARDVYFDKAVLAFTMVVLCTFLVLAAARHLVEAVLFQSMSALLNSVIPSALTVLALWLTPYAIRLADSKRDKARRKEQKSLKQSLKAAGALSDVIPVFTKEHAEAGLRLDALVNDLSPRWKQPDTDRVRTLIFADMTREFTIHSLITERGLKTADEVIEALAEMEENKKPLQDGWL